MGFESKFIFARKNAMFGKHEDHACALCRADVQIYLANRDPASQSVSQDVSVSNIWFCPHGARVAHSRLQG